MIELKNLSKQFETLDGSVDALRNINLTIQDGDVYGIIGMSGAGKSTLVRCINMLERPTEGSVLVNGKDMGTMSQKELRTMRRKITMIFQGFNLLMQRTCLNNIMLPLRLGGADKKTAEAKARELLELVDLPDKANSYPAQLSGGQQQRVAIARAIAQAPPVILADEPTGNLDSASSKEILGILKALYKDGRTVILITHDNGIAAQARRIIRIMDGKIVEDRENPADDPSPKKMPTVTPKPATANARETAPTISTATAPATVPETIPTATTEAVSVAATDAISAAASEAISDVQTKAQLTDQINNTQEQKRS